MWPLITKKHTQSGLALDMKCDTIHNITINQLEFSLQYRLSQRMPHCPIYHKIMTLYYNVMAVESLTD